MKNNTKNYETNRAWLYLFFRRMKWIFLKSGVIPLAFEHFLAMIPATILVPVLVNKSFDGATIIDMSLVLFTSGLGTILFTVVSRGKIPTYIGSSFAYITLTIYLINERTNFGTTPTMAFSYVAWSYVFSGILLIMLSILYKFKFFKNLLPKIFPATVIGPAISLIGLELADTAIVDSGFGIGDGMIDGNAALIAITTLATIILFSLVRHKVLKNMAIVVGVVVGCILSFSINGFPEGVFDGTMWFSIPEFKLPLFTVPPNLLGLFMAVVPPTIIVFVENISRVTVIGQMTCCDDEVSYNEIENLDNAEFIDEDSGENKLFTDKTLKRMRSSLVSHGISIIVAGFLGSVPNTLYAENIAVMSIHRRDMKRTEPDKFIQKLTSPYSVAPYIIAACIAIIFSFVNVLQSFLENLPKPVMGGMELFLFGIISAPGIQILVEQRVNYKKISNQIVTAAVLISGIGGLSVQFWNFELKGMSLGLVVGVILNAVVLVLKFIGNISDELTYDEIISECLSKFSSTTKLRVLGYRKKNESNIDHKKNCSIVALVYALQGKNCSVRMGDSWITSDTIRDDIIHADMLEIGLNYESEVVAKFRKTANGLFVDIRSSEIDENIRVSYLNDYASIDEDGEWMIINVSEGIPIRRVKEILETVDDRYKE
ncbi:MAG: hypothetical protein IJZ51_06820 [Ruminiclostridium sp.]|nr:hypothetical protein [Ruminiclostridium sp.]